MSDAEDLLAAFDAFRKEQAETLAALRREVARMERARRGRHRPAEASRRRGVRGGDGAIAHKGSEGRA